jgi:hypothetical protein
MAKDASEDKPLPIAVDNRIGARGCGDLTVLRACALACFRLAPKVGRHRLKSDPLCLTGHRGGKAFSAFDLVTQVVGIRHGRSFPSILPRHPQNLAIRPPFAVAGRALPGPALYTPCAGSVRHIRHTHTLVGLIVITEVCTLSLFRWNSLRMLFPQLEQHAQPYICVTPIPIQEAQLI